MPDFTNLTQGQGVGYTQWIQGLVDLGVEVDADDHRFGEAFKAGLSPRQVVAAAEAVAAGL